MQSGSSGGFFRTGHQEAGLFASRLAQDRARVRGQAPLAAINGPLRQAIDRLAPSEGGKRRPLRDKIAHDATFLSSER
jgi:hypothetical protein